MLQTARVSIGLDPDDNMFLECAETAHADYLITGNKRHFPSVWRSADRQRSRRRRTGIGFRVTLIPAIAGCIYGFRLSWKHGKPHR